VEESGLSWIKTLILHVKDDGTAVDGEMRVFDQVPSEVFKVFRGNHIARIDEKGRLKVPAEFKRILDEKYGATFFITSFDGERAEIFPMPEWEKIEAEMAARPSSPQKTKFLEVTNYYGQVVEMDGQGRLLLPQNLRDKAGLAGDLAVLGLQTRLAAINDEQQVARIKAAPLTGDDFATLAVPGL
jgi:MraZ protein